MKYMVLFMLLMLWGCPKAQTAEAVQAAPEATAAQDVANEIAADPGAVPEEKADPAP